VQFVHELNDATADDSSPSAIPDLCPAGPNEELDAPASAFDDLF